MSNIVTGIDIGSYHVKVVIARSDDAERVLPTILGTGYAESRGITEGYVTSVPEAARSVKAALAQAARAARVRPKRVYLGVNGIGLDEATARGEVVVERGDSEVTQRDLARALKASEVSLPATTLLNRRVLHAIPLRYYIDGTRVLGHNPAGMKGARVAVETLFITCLERHVSDLAAVVNEAGVEVEDVVASPIAASFVTLSKMQKRVGCVLANIGSETLSVAVFEDSIPLSVKVFPTGGNDITHDLALGLRISPEEAEQLKLGAILGATFPKRTVDQIIARRVTDMFKLLDAHLKKIGKAELLPAGVVLTGGGASLASASDLAKAVLKLPSRSAAMADGSAAKVQLRDGSWAVAYGLTVWGLTAGGDFEPHEGGGFFDIFKNFWSWFKKFLP